MKKFHYTYEPPSVLYEGEYYFPHPRNTQLYTSGRLPTEIEECSVIVKVVDESRKALIHHIMKKPWSPYYPEEKIIIYTKR